MIGAATARRAQDVGWTRGKIFDSNISSTDSFVASSFSSGRKHLTRLTIPPRQAASHPLVVRRAESPNRHFDSCVRNQMRHYRLCKTTGVALDMVETRGGTASGEGPPSALWKPGIRRDRHWNGAAKALSLEDRLELNVCGTWPALPACAIGWRRRAIWTFLAAAK